MSTIETSRARCASKKFKAALAVTAAHDPIAERAKATAKAAIASVLATYKDKAAV